MDDHQHSANPLANQAMMELIRRNQSDANSVIGPNRLGVGALGTGLGLLLAGQPVGAVPAIAGAALGMGTQGQMPEARRQEFQADALRNILMQRMQGGQSHELPMPGVQGGPGLPPGLLDQ